MVFEHVQEVLTWGWVLLKIWCLSERVKFKVKLGCFFFVFPLVYFLVFARSSTLEECSDLSVSSQNYRCLSGLCQRHTGRQWAFSTPPGSAAASGTAPYPIPGVWWQMLCRWGPPQPARWGWGCCAERICWGCLCSSGPVPSIHHPHKPHSDLSSSAVGSYLPCFGGFWFTLI